MQIKDDAQLSELLVRLLKGAVTASDKIWPHLLMVRRSVNDYFSMIGLKLELYEEDGFAFLSQQDEDELLYPLPKLVRRQPLTFEISLLLVILREELDRFDSSPEVGSTLFLSRQEIRNLIALYFEEKGDEVRLIRDLDRYISQVAKMGFLKPAAGGNIEIDDERGIFPEESSGDQVYIVQRMIRARVTPAFLAEFKEKLEAVFGSLS